MNDIELKKQIKRYGRKRFAAEMPMLYGTLSSKLNGFIKFSTDELDRIDKILTTWDSTDHMVIDNLNQE